MCTSCTPLPPSTTSFGLFGKRVDPVADDDDDDDVGGLAIGTCSRDDGCPTLVSPSPLLPSPIPIPAPLPIPLALWRWCECVKAVDGAVLARRLVLCVPRVNFSCEDRGTFCRNSFSQSVWVFASVSVDADGWALAACSGWWWKEVLPNLEGELGW